MGFQDGVEQRCAVINISDTGIGIPQDAMGNIFMPFFRVNDYQSGIGLGLSPIRIRVAPSVGESNYRIARRPRIETHGSYHFRLTGFLSYGLAAR